MRETTIIPETRSACCGAELLNHWLCDERTRCAKCGICPNCVPMDQAAVMDETERQAARQRFRR
jgi:hypothetical protein